jgi:hypothetical protein
MSTPITLTAPHPWYVRPTLRAITVAALVINALSFVPYLVSSNPIIPYDLSLIHIIPTLVVAGIVASRLRWAPALGALLGGLLLLEAYVFLTNMLVQPTSAADFANTDTSIHHFDIDEFNVHVLMPPGKSNLALFTPTQPGTYTFYCQPHADKAARTGMIGTLIVEP